MSDKRCNQPEFLTGLIDMYRSNPCLWKIKSKNYSNRLMRDKAYSSLLNYYKSCDENATIDTLKNKINNLRSSFRKELKKVNKSKKSGSGSEEIYTPTLWYFKLLLFTSDQEEALQPISNDNDDHMDAEVSDNETEENMEDYNNPASTFSVGSEDTNIITSVISPEPPSPASSSRTTSRLSSTPATRSTSKRQLTEQRDIIERVCGAFERADKTDEFSIIGENVAHKLRRIDEQQRMYAENLINKLLFYALQNKLNPESDVILNETVTNVNNCNYETNQTPSSNQSSVPQLQYPQHQFAQPYAVHQTRLYPNSYEHATPTSPIATPSFNEEALPEQIESELIELITIKK